MMIEVANLTRFYGEFPALYDVSFTASDGEVIGLLGLNGAGKSTALKILAGLVPPSSGTVLIDGVDLVSAPDVVQRSIGYLPEDPPLYTDMRVGEFVRYIGRLKGLSETEVDQRLPKVLEIAQLTERVDQVIETLSHGYRKRVGIAQAIIHDPGLLILDEPISGLDPVQIVGMRAVIRSLSEGRVVFVSSHILSEIEQTCDRLLVLRDGKLVAEGSEEELTKQLTRPRLDLSVRDPDDTFVTWLTSHDAVAEVIQSSRDEHITHATVQLDADTREQLAADLVAAGYGLRSLEAGAHALEAMFLGLTKQGEG
jgi:ABC-2 type transport system ATP-binding protein